MAAPIAALQQHLERLYEVDPGYLAEQFLVSERNDLPGIPAPHAPEEELLLSQGGGDLELALYLSAALLERLHRDDPLDRLHDGNFADLCLAIEGVSHFLYVAWNARRDHPVTRLELELQAEVDKYIISTLLFGRQGRGRVPRNLHGRLFRHCRIASPLPHAERQRYHWANRYAAHYCHYLQRRYLRPGELPSLVRELRRFYRLHGGDKLRHIEGLGRLH